MVTRVYPKPLATEYGSLRVFAWVGTVTTLVIPVNTEGLMRLAVESRLFDLEIIRTLQGLSAH